MGEENLVLISALGESNRAHDGGKRNNRTRTESDRQKNENTFSFPK